MKGEGHIHPVRGVILLPVGYLTGSLRSEGCIHGKLTPSAALSSRLLRRWLEPNDVIGSWVEGTQGLVSIMRQPPSVIMLVLVYLVCCAVLCCGGDDDDDDD